MLIDTRGVTFGLHNSLIIPIGAKSKASIQKFVGTIDKVFKNNAAFLVSFLPLEGPNELEVWKHKRSFLLNYSTQLWVDIDYRNYRKLYQSVFEKLIEDQAYVVDHIMNRKLARALGYKFVRLLHISRASNSSGGRGGETFANTNLPTSLSVNPEINTGDIVYADPMDLLKMLNVKVGGFGLETVRDNHHLLFGPKNY
ncbi:hypothetical protein FNH22_00145 [Fulvivirga sp. M361]|uniref:hypothetical protein n=1 Tax=Fulvivirga sp. M361 TaxID=2594266 RepID=UPI00117BAE48|nr:hypothetical protein [Fulvivirga sp. M361]TRX62541.1 hypothetical protein FNH22_00145 [Fulvivirga sp. M361]